MIKMFITVLFICIGLADTITITPTQTGVLTHNALCCGYNTYYDSGTSLQWIGDCNANYFGCVSSSLAGVWRWDISSLEGATINSAEIDFTFQNQNCSNGADFGFGSISGNMTSSQALILYDNAQQSGSSNLYSPIDVNSYVLSDAQESGNLGAILSTSYSCAVYSTGNSAPELTINYTPECSYNNCEDCFEAGCFWQDVAGGDCFNECIIQDVDCYGSGNDWVAECPEESESTFGYLREIEVSDCQDECSQYTIELEIDGGFGPIPIISQYSDWNMDLYVNRFVKVDLGQEVTCVECSAFEINQINLSDECQFPVDCFENPCYEVDYCDINIPVECIANYCGGCYADFYDLEGNLVDCYASSDECIDLSGLDFGSCAMFLGIGYVNGECSYVSGCGWILNGIDYSDAFFDSMDECSSVCFENSFTLGDINNDSLINVQDIVLLISFVLQIDFPTDTEFLAADLNSDGLLNILDIVALVNIILGN
jgi:hypothetical protein